MVGLQYGSLAHTELYFHNYEIFQRFFQTEMDRMEKRDIKQCNYDKSLSAKLPIISCNDCQQRI